MNLVHPGVSARKVERELALWDANAEAYSRRGWIMLRREPPLLDIAFLALLPIAGNVVPAVAACVQIDFTNFDLWAPSVEFIDPIGREFAPPVVQALVEVEGGAQNLIVGGHPDTGRPFLCIPGVRQYHCHPQHTGDPWLLHRPPRGGTLSLICERIWQTMARTLLGVQVQLVTLPGSVQLNVQLVSAPGEQAPAMWAQARQQPAEQHTQAAGTVIAGVLGIEPPRPAVNAEKESGDARQRQGVHRPARDRVADAAPAARRGTPRPRGVRALGRPR